MEWREQSNVSCDEAYREAQRWLEAVTKKKFGTNDFRSALENGVLLCDLINNIKPGIIKRVNRLPTPIAGLDNLNVFLKACGKLGLKEAQLFHPGDLQDLSSRVTVRHQETKRRLKNVLITIYWLGRRANCDPFYDGPHLNLKAFEGLLGTTLYKALQESSSQKGSNVRDSGFGDSWYSEREELYQLRGGGGGGGGGGGRHRRDDSLDSLDSVGSRPHSISSDTTLKGSCEGCCSDTEADCLFKMAENKNSLSYRRSAAITPKTATQFNQFLPSQDKPSGYVPAPLRKKRADNRNEDSRRSWASPVFTQDDGTFTRLHQIEDGSDGSKSVSDIQVDPGVVRQERFEELQKFREQLKDSEDKWQDDLTKWKNRRKSVNSDIVKKKEEREKIEEITHSSSNQETRRKTSVGSRLRSLSYLDDGDVFESPVPAPRTHTFPERSYTIDTPYHSSDFSAPALREEEPPFASTATGRADSPPTSRVADIVADRVVRNDATTTIAATSHTSVRSPRSHTSPTAAPLGTYTSRTKTEEISTAVSTISSVLKRPEPRYSLVDTQTEMEAPSSGSLYKQPQSSSMEPKPPGVSRVSASLPRSYQRSDGSRLSAVVTPRPFGTQATRITSLPRTLPMDDPYKRVNGNVDASKKSSVPGRYHHVMTSEDEAQSSSTHSSEDEEEEKEVGETKGKSMTSTLSSVPVLPQVKSEAPAVTPAPAKDSSQDNYCKLRISLNQKPNSSRDFGFQADWDSTGARVTSIQSGSPAEMCQLQPSDEVLTVNGHQVADMSYTGWKSHLDEALQEGSLVMDIRRWGKNTWGRNQPSLPYKSHKTINLTSMDHPILLGSSDGSSVKSSLNFTSRTFMEPLKTNEVTTNPIIDVATNGVNGGFRNEPVTMRNKESEPISLKNLKRRSEFFEQGGSESAVSDISVPSIAPPSNRWSWNPEDERKRQEKWQKEQERLLQEKYKRDQEKLQEEWRKAQQDISKSVDQQAEPESLEVNSRSVSPRSPLSPLSRPSPLWEDQAEQERKNKQEQEQELERRRQAEERRRREEEERELQRLQEERKRRERQEVEARKRREEEELKWQRKREEEREEERRRQEAVEQQRRERERALHQQQQWVKSKSSPQLDEEGKPEGKGVYVQPGGMAHWLLEEQMRSSRDKHAQSERAASELELERRNILNAMRYRQPERVTDSGLGEASWRDSQRKGQQPGSHAEQERQQILKEMKKKTPLLTDSSWIRQRSATMAANKEPDEAPMRRGESLDNLDGNSRRSSWTPRGGYSRTHSAFSGGSAPFHAGGLGVRQAPPTLPSSYSMGSLRGGAGTPSSPGSRQSTSPSLSSPSPTTSPEPMSETRAPQQNTRSVSGRKICTFCENPLGKGAAMIIESLGLCYHLSCFKCIDCKSDLGGSQAGAEVRIRNKQLYCNTCYMRFKTNQPTAM
ncbi:LIM domain only protein 7 isoform X3 [Genypterus blacodes]|uniref:LIM domain only protein 7 isoform X3 n=1 Tax=Genypterus blacodes TaxID=154954 RepID=UPI003F75EA27